jgi:hypothetical protein
VAFNDPETALVEEIEDSEEHTLNGIMEYGYGFWSKFLYNGPAKLVDKPEWMGLTRMTTNRNFEDATRPGDRTLAIWIGRGFYHFTTYDEENKDKI